VGLDIRRPGAGLAENQRQGTAKLSRSGGANLQTREAPISTTGPLRRRNRPEAGGPARQPYGSNVTPLACRFKSRPDEPLHAAGIPLAPAEGRPARSLTAPWRSN
jgi:hypothetical protein